MKLNTVVDPDILQAMQDAFFNATGLGVHTVDYKGHPLLNHSGLTPFWEKMRTSSIYKEGCMRGDAHGGLEAARKGEVSFYKCHLGLIHFAVPIITKGEYIGAIICGGVKCKDVKELDLHLPNLKDTNFLKDINILKLFDQIPEVSFKKLKSASVILRKIINYIIERHLLDKENDELLQKQQENSNLKAQLKEFEIKYYHSQINPHFLFNTLNIAGRQAYLEGAGKTQEIIYTTAEIYRKYLQKASVLVTLKEELENIKNYMFIQNVRFGQELVFKDNVDRELLSYQLPTMCLQILIENAVGHGLEPKENLGTVKLDITKENEIILLTLSDDGVGISEEILNQLNTPYPVEISTNKSPGLGIQNIRKLLGHFNAGYKLSFKSTLGKGTCVELILPL